MGIRSIEEVSDAIALPMERRMTQAFMTQRSATKIAELLEAGRGMPWLAGVELRVVPVGATIIGKGGRRVVLADEGAIIFAPETSRAVEP